ncbi:hypothetical protein [Schinkia azotoformans]|uniref:hypothetical protein n=1 Tax=Schinkia azotoformans TaxID=1454 RepID=UPI002DB9DF70|nr:hypothetical protein [Schinkia azotoformans]MEC1778420.1 hypothetical protein [Schinkia azotoformans]MED4328335.1 hypothetical protein [Schinkia azotoformans]
MEKKVVNNLEKQITIYSLDTSSFYNKEEFELNQEIESLNLELYILKELLKLSGKERTEKFNGFAESNDKDLMDTINEHLVNTEAHELKVNGLKENLGFLKQENKSLRSNNTELRKQKKVKGTPKEEKDKLDLQIQLNKETIESNKLQIELLKVELKEMKSPKKILKDQLDSKKDELKSMFDNNKTVRVLRDDALVINNAVNVFDSVLTRTLKCSNEDICTDIMIVQSYYYSVLEDLIVNGFVDSQGEQYIYYSSSAGQIRKKRGVWIKKSLWDKYENTLMCGLTKDKINAKGGINLTKYQAYKSLSASASTEWVDFSIRDCIVVDDLEVTIHSEVDYINRDTYEIKREENYPIPIEITDGCGIMLPSVSEKCFQVRLPHIKGLLCPFDFREFQKKHEGAKVTITDIYNDTHDINDVSIIFTRSQFKMADYYDSWGQYQKYFEDYNCKAAKLNEEDTSAEATLTYQMLQTLVDIKQEELQEIASATTNDIQLIGRDLDTILRIMGVSEDNKRMNHFQKALLMYPELINDEHTKETIKSKKESLIEDSKAGKLRIEGAKYTFLIPDLYAFAQKIFGLPVTGLLDDGEVYCRLYDEGEMCVLRSPHLYREWGIRNNVKNKEMSDWFITDGIYTSIKDNLSKMLQFDNDGDKSLCLQSPKVTEIAKRNMKGIVPLYYEMAKAGAEMIDNQSLYNSLIEAYKANVGIVSNNITKIWNSKNVDDNALKAIKWLCMESNFQIDRAKTNFMTTRPEHVSEIIKDLINGKVPYFFKYNKPAKYGDEKYGKLLFDENGKKVKVNGKFIKVNDKVEPINNSTVNRLEAIIDKANKRIAFTKVAGKFDYKKLMTNPDIKIDDVIGKEIIKKYTELDRNKKWMMNNKEEHKSTEYLPVYKFIRKELMKIANPSRIADVLVKYLYSGKSSKDKSTLWSSFGKEIIANLKYNLHGIKDCKCCGNEFEAKNNKVKYCSNECSEEMKKKQDRIADKKYRGKVKNEKSNTIKLSKAL